MLAEMVVAVLCASRFLVGIVFVPGRSDRTIEPAMSEPIDEVMDQVYRRVGKCKVICTEGGVGADLNSSETVAVAKREREVLLQYR